MDALGLIIIILIAAGISKIRADYFLKDREIYRLKQTVESYIDKSNKELNQHIEDAQSQISKSRQELNRDIEEYNRQLTATKSHLTAFPYMAKIIADFDTRHIELLARNLDWGSDQKRLKKVQSIREIRRETVEQIVQYKQAEYQLAYAMQMFPALEDFFETEYSDIQGITISDLSEENHDRVRNYLTSAEYTSLSSTARNQLALDRYVASHQKTTWQIGRDYELYVGYRYSQKGYSIDYFGAYNGLEDLGRDLIAKKGNLTLIIQCKYWSAKKEIHEKHINQLYGTMACYCFENNLAPSSVQGILVTNITVSDTARKFANYLGIKLVENYALGNFPRIKCNINSKEHGELTKIYHLPFDQQYDSCKIDQPGEFMAMTVDEAEAAGFRRAYRWHS